MVSELFLYRSLVLVLSLLISLVLSPFEAALARWRAHYSPKHRQNRAGERKQLAEEEDSSTIRKGYFTILRRIYTVEGFAGYYKGILPTFAILLYAAIADFETKLPGDPSTPTPPMSPDSKFAVIARWVYFALVFMGDIPLQVLLNRAIVTPYKLPWTSPSRCLSVLLSESELRSPWKLYLLPGYFMSQLVVWVFLSGVRPIHSALFPTPVTLDSDLHVWKVATLFRLLKSLVQTPIQVAAVRLSLQRYPDSVEESRKDRPSVVLERFSEEDVIVLRDATKPHPYTGLLDCLNRILLEEGRTTLLRSGWLTFLGI